MQVAPTPETVEAVVGASCGSQRLRPIVCAPGLICQVCKCALTLCPRCVSNKWLVYKRRPCLSTCGRFQSYACIADRAPHTHLLTNGVTITMLSYCACANPCLKAHPLYAGSSVECAKDSTAIGHVKAQRLRSRVTCISSVKSDKNICALFPGPDSESSRCGGCARRMRHCTNTAGAAASATWGKVRWLPPGSHAHLQRGPNLQGGDPVSKMTSRLPQTNAEAIVLSYPLTALSILGRHVHFRVLQTAFVHALCCASRYLGGLIMMGGVYAQTFICADGISIEKWMAQPIWLLPFFLSQKPTDCASYFAVHRPTRQLLTCLASASLLRRHRHSAPRAVSAVALPEFPVALD